ncbi:MAG: radical SAM protein [Promethearchaeota archaeon]
MQYEKIQAKTLLSKLHYGDTWFHSHRHMNSYRGCEHGCVYCDGNCQYYRIDNFYTHIRIKENAPQILRKELERAKLRSQSRVKSETLVRFLNDKDASKLIDQGPQKIIVGISGGVSDAYQQAEEEYRITRQVLETLHDFRLPVFILTKSASVLEDLDLLKEIHEQAFVNVCFSITLHDEEMKTIFEPKSSATWERFAALKEIRRAGLFGGVYAYPCIPTIGDSIENMEGLAKDAKKAEAEFILFSGMTLKPGRQKAYFFNVVRRQVPESFDLLQQIYANNHTYGYPIMDLLPVNVMIQGRQICKEVGISDRSLRHKIPGESPLNIKVLNSLLDIVFYQSMVLGKHRETWQPYLHAAIQIERSNSEIADLIQQGVLEEQLGIHSAIAEEIQEILSKGTGPILEQTKKELDNLGKTRSLRNREKDHKRVKS